MAAQSDYYLPISVPPVWNSAFNPIEFIYDMPTEPAGISDVDGYMTIDTAYGFNNALIVVKVGDLLWVDGGVYRGYHVVRKVISISSFQTETIYTALGFEFVKYAQPPVWEIYKGIVGDLSFPFTKVADFQPEPNKEGYLSFNISGYIQSSLPIIVPPLEGTLVSSDYRYIDTNLYTPFQILHDDTSEYTYYALNCAIETALLNSDYVDTGKALSTNPFVFQNGETWLSYIEGVTIITKRTE